MLDKTASLTIPFSKRAADRVHESQSDDVVRVFADRLPANVFRTIDVLGPIGPAHLGCWRYMGMRCVKPQFASRPLKQSPRREQPTIKYRLNTGYKYLFLSE